MKVSDLYSSLVTSPVELGTVMFKAAFPGLDEKETAKKAKQLKRGSEDIFEDFYEAWQKRVRTAIKAELDAGSSVHTLLKMVPFLTVEEFQQILTLTDEFLPEDTLAMFAMRVRELDAHVSNVTAGANEIFKEEYKEFMEAKEKTKKNSRILTGNQLIEPIA